MDTAKNEITINGFNYRFKVIDNTHISWEVNISEKWISGIPMHIQQLSEEMHSSLIIFGLSDGKRFIV